MFSTLFNNKAIFYGDFSGFFSLCFQSLVINNYCRMHVEGLQKMYEILWTLIIIASEKKLYHNLLCIKHCAEILDNDTDDICSKLKIHN